MIEKINEQAIENMKTFKKSFSFALETKNTKEEEEKFKDNPIDFHMKNIWRANEPIQNHKLNILSRSFSSFYLTLYAVSKKEYDMSYLANDLEYVTNLNFTNTINNYLKKEYFADMKKYPKAQKIIINEFKKIDKDKDIFEKYIRINNIFCSITNTLFDKKYNRQEELSIINIEDLKILNEINIKIIKFKNLLRDTFADVINKNKVIDDNDFVKAEKDLEKLLDILGAIHQHLTFIMRFNFKEIIILKNIIILNEEWNKTIEKYKKIKERDNDEEKLILLGKIYKMRDDFINMCDQNPIENLRYDISDELKEDLLRIKLKNSKKEKTFDSKRVKI